MSLVNGGARPPKQQPQVFGMAGMVRGHQPHPGQMMYQQHPHAQFSPSGASSTGTYPPSPEEIKMQQMHFHELQMKQHIQQQAQQPGLMQPQLGASQFFCTQGVHQPGQTPHYAACNNVSNRGPCTTQAPGAPSQYNPYF